MWLGAFVERETGSSTNPSAAPASTSGTASATSTPGIRPERHRPHPRRTSRGRVPDPPRVRLLDPGDGVRRLRRHRQRRRPHALHLGHADLRRESTPGGEFIVATENGMLYPLQQAAPKANLIEANRMAVCKYMKMITLPKLRDSLARDEVRGQRPAGDRREGEAADRAHGRDRVGPAAELPKDAAVSATALAGCGRGRDGRECGKSDETLLDERPGSVRVPATDCADSVTKVHGTSHRCIGLNSRNTDPTPPMGA